MNAIIVDDEELSLRLLKHQINKIGGVKIIGGFNNFDIEKNTALLKEVDIVFLDIIMPEVNGLELAKKIIIINPDIIIIFVTAFDDYAVQAFELNALDYLLKPVQMKRLKKTLKRVESKLNNPIHKPKINNVLKVNVSRELSFESTGGKIEFLQWRTTKAQELFLYLLHNYGKTIRKSELIELLWPDFEEERAYSQLYTTIYHIRNALKKYHKHFTIKSMGESYTLLIKNVFIDLVEWEKSIKEAPPLTTETIDIYEENMKLYSGIFLQEYDYLWAESERYRLKQIWLKVAYQIADFYYKQNHFEKAEAWYINICTSVPEEEDAHFSLMKLYKLLGLGLQIDRQYNLLMEALEELGLEVSQEIRKWFKQCRSSIVT